MAKLLKFLEARVLVDIKELGVAANHILVSTPEHIATLVKAGLVDAEEAAVDYVKSIGAPRVELQATDKGDAVQAAAESRAASIKALKAADSETAAAEEQAANVQTSAPAADATEGSAAGDAPEGLAAQ